ncbi:fluoride efflux transporter FluC [Carboxydothermus ferrireducens]|uniref:Fluoride-specific ion channel FluC n=1 Tax=Carboxydothermus ferrireducens DSM 11255 TaxID=1119529 RepID=A0ABX2RC98_9THEO|nr:CrcB family protein [Carboxydothermus ferrireducens]NYE58817.1 CrcB protein [Carboxydothermus ferrireducens DSM 11255]
MNYFAVALGGFFGAIAREITGRALGTSIFPVSTLAINLSGSFLLLFFMTLFLERITVSDTVRLGLTSGFLGAYTTFSTMTKEIYLLLLQSKLLIGFAYLFLSLSGGFLSGILGRALALYLVNLNFRKNTVKDEG